MIDAVPANDGTRRQNHMHVWMVSYAPGIAWHTQRKAAMEGHAHTELRHSHRLKWHIYLQKALLAV